MKVLSNTAKMYGTVHFLLGFSLFAFFAVPGGINAQKTQWDSHNFPNPTSGDFHRCRMRSTSQLCDPDEVLSEQERYRVNYELGMLESSTRQENGRDFCERKGISAAVGIARQVKGGQEQDVRNMANDMLKRWTLDKQCEKAIVIVLSVDDRRFWVARMPRVPVYAQEFTEIFKNEQGTFRAGRHAQGLQNIVRAIRERTASKQVSAARPGDDGRSRGTPFVPQPKPQPQPHPTKKTQSKGWLGGISWLIIVLIILFIVIPLLCCCCCVYFCCIRKKDNSASANRSPDAEGGGTGTTDDGRRRRGAGGLPLAGLVGGAGGLISGFFNKRRDAGGASGGGGVPPHYSPVWQDDKKGDAKGLYPSAPVKDEGGGGSF